MVKTNLHNEPQKRLCRPLCGKSLTFRKTFTNLRGCAARCEAQPQCVLEKLFRRGEAVAAQQAAQPQNDLI